MTRLRVFVAEDNVAFASLLQASLENLTGVTVVGWAMRADTAMRQIRDAAPDVALIDLQLAHGDGYQVLDLFGRTGTVSRPHKLWAMTSAWSPSVQAACLAAGADECFDKAEFRKIIASVARLRRR
jgi:CheY-like chemotaxis protein